MKTLEFFKDKIENNLKIDRTLPFKLYPTQEELLKDIINNDKDIISYEYPRKSGVTSLMAAYVAIQILYNETPNYLIGLYGKDMNTSHLIGLACNFIEILTNNEIKYKTHNKNKIELINGNAIVCINTPQKLVGKRFNELISDNGIIEESTFNKLTCLCKQINTKIINVKTV